ncbi:MAG: 23S rRNA (pseudouridine(1915)-N(3))-methyltransferase RlmH [Gemmatimonadetes bacterium]|nr:23S rRNA (pseudouridine(1915)-N(3))-methyltransferase RlmH [Gemmatimonadota bacterium]
MKVIVIAVGRVRGDLAPAVAGYEARAAHYWKLETVEVDAGAGGREDRDSVMAAEADRLLTRIPDGAEVVALTRDGKSWSSLRLSKYLGDRGLHGLGDVVFVIGGAFGLDPRVLARAARRLSLSAMTLPHEMARLVLAEQLYRAGSILRNEPYHKGRH